LAFSLHVREEAFVSCGRRCCLCHKYCGTKMELHHIIQRADGGADTFENAVPLCFDCHAEVKSFNPHHPKGSPITENELRRDRDSWYAKIAQPISYTSKDPVAMVDKKVFIALNQYLSSYSFEWIREQNFAGSAKRIDYLYFKDFLRKARMPAYEYLNADLESAKANLANSIVEFYNVANTHISCDEYVCQTSKEFRYTEPELYKIFYQSLNALADEVWKSYCEYIRTCKLVLNVSIEIIAND